GAATLGLVRRPVQLGVTRRLGRLGVEDLALVADDGGDVGVGQRALERRHGAEAPGLGDVLTAGAVRVAIRRPRRRRAVVHPGDLVEPFREGEQLLPGERAAGAAFATGAVASGAVGEVHLFTVGDLG